MFNRNVQPDSETLSPVNEGVSNGTRYNYLLGFNTLFSSNRAAAPDLNLSNMAPPETPVVGTAVGVGVGG